MKRALPIGLVTVALMLGTAGAVGANTAESSRQMGTVHTTAGLTVQDGQVDAAGEQGAANQDAEQGTANQGGDQGQSGDSGQVGEQGQVNQSGDQGQSGELGNK